MDEREQGTGEVEEERWSVKQVIDGVNGRFRKLGLPRMRKPAGLDEEYDFPTKVSVLTSTQLGDLRLKLQSWLSWTLIVIGDKESDLTAIQMAYDMTLGVRMHEISQTYEKNKPVKETLMALAVQGDPRLKTLARTLTSEKMFIRKATAQADVYRGQLNDLSRELTRRDSEARN